MPTLYAVWLERRVKLNGHETLPHFEDSVRVLDWLIARYADDPAAQVAARVPRESSLLINDRTIIVHNYLSTSEFDATRVEADAHHRARTVLSRIAKLDLQADACAPSSRINALPPDGPDMPPFSRVPFLDTEIDRSDEFVARCKAALLRGGTLWQGDMKSMQRVFERAMHGPPIKVGMGEVLEVLALCGYPDVTRNVLALWRAKSHPDFQSLFETYLRTHELGAKLLRGDLTSSEGYKRIVAARLLGPFGTLNDILLFQDLLDLPEMHTPSPERHAYLMSMRKLARMVDEEPVEVFATE
ncbi:MAG: hypothetical protein WCT04_14435 [Planctomycetota bacterium]